LCVKPEPIEIRITVPWPRFNHILFFFLQKALKICIKFYQFVVLTVYGSTAFVDLGRFFSFLIRYSVGRNPWTGDQPVARPLPTHRTTQTQNKRIQTSIPRVGFEPRIPVFERAKIVHALDRAVTVIGNFYYCYSQIKILISVDTNIICFRIVDGCDL
jgi:hypothetical protein